MPEYVRVKDKDTRHEYSVVASAVDPEFHTVLKKDAANADGTPLPAKHYVDLSSRTDLYESRTVGDLKDELARRNATRPADAQLEVGGQGNKPDLIAALIADDEENPDGLSAELAEEIS